MKNVFIIHGINGIPKIAFWLKNKLEALGADVTLPSFPPQEGASYDNWSEVLDKYRDSIKDDTIFVCHSIGNEFIIKYLVRNNLHIDTYISLAGFAEIFINEGRDVLNKVVEHFHVTSDEVRKFISLTNRRYSFYSDNDHIVPLDVLENYPKTINAEPIFIPNIGHMGSKSGLESFPELLRLVKDNLR